MNTPRQISLNVREALEQKKFKRALSILEQGIAGLAREPHINYRDDEPLTLLRINQRIINSLDEQGIRTVFDNFVVARLQATSLFLAIDNLTVVQVEVVVYNRLIGTKLRNVSSHYFTSSSSNAFLNACWTNAESVVCRGSSFFPPHTSQYFHQSLFHGFP